MESGESAGTPLKLQFPISNLQSPIATANISRYNASTKFSRSSKWESGLRDASGGAGGAANTAD